MGAALKLDPTRIRVPEFWQVKGDPLARALRKRFKSLSKREKSDVYINSSEREETRPEVKQNDQYPRRKFKCVYSDELLQNKGHNTTCGTEQCMCPKAKLGPGDPNLLNHEWCSSKAQINGTMAHITAIFGFMLAGLVIQDVTDA